MTADELVAVLRLSPLEPEGGYFRETYRSARSTAIYYLLTPGTFSAIHRLPWDEVFHFYLGDPVEMLQLSPDGGGRIVALGTALSAGMRPQVVVPAGTWQGARLAKGGAFALLGTTMAPGFDAADYEAGDRALLAASHPAFRDMIVALTR